jgi:flap endonuclease-1
MGIKGLFKFIQKYAPSAIKELQIDDLKNKTIAFDTSILIYQFVIAIRNSGVDLTDSSGNMTSHIHAIIIKTLSFLKKKINPIYVFDGKPPDIKKGTLKERTKSRQSAIEALNTQVEITEEDKIKLLKQSVVISGKQMDDCKEILKYIGIPVINALQEADSQCALLSKLKLVDGIASEDMDLLTFGTEKLLRNINGKRIIEITLSNILLEANLSYDQFIDLCIMLGCDYCPTIDGVGMIKSYELIKKYNSLENIVNISDLRIGRKNVNITNEFREKYILAREYFKNPPVNENFGEIKWDKTNFTELKSIMINKYSYSEFNVNKLLNKPLLYGHYKTIVNKNLNQIKIDKEFNIYANILNINTKNNNSDIDETYEDLFLDEDDDIIVENILLNRSMNVKNLVDI